MADTLYSPADQVGDAGVAAAARVAATSPAKAPARVPNAVLYDRWFKLADSDMDSRLTGADAVAFFRRSGLPREVLAKVWELSNTSRTGYLDRPSFHKAMDLIALAQNGHEVNKANYTAALRFGIPLPQLAGLEVAAAGAATPDDDDDEPAVPTGAAAATAAAAVPQQQPPKQQQQQNQQQQQQQQADRRKVKSGKQSIPRQVVTSVVDGLKAIYFQKVCSVIR